MTPKEKLLQTISQALDVFEEDTYRRGLGDATKAIISSVNRFTSTAIPVAEKPPEEAGLPVARAKRAGKTPARVEEIIKQAPGVRGVVIVQTLAPIPERTVRTALRRLRNAGRIEKRGDAWFPKNSGSADVGASAQPPLFSKVNHAAA